MHALARVLLIVASMALVACEYDDNVHCDDGCNGNEQTDADICNVDCQA